MSVVEPRTFQELFTVLKVGGHHAYICVGILPGFLVSGVHVVGSETVETLVFSFDSLALSDTEVLLREATRNVPAGHHRLVVVRTFECTDEAQNAFLKKLEEPTSGVVFLFFVPDEQVLFTTVRSRAQTIVLVRGGEPSSTQAVEFLAGDIVHRRKILTPFLEGETEARRERLAEFTHFLSMLERYISQDFMQANTEDVLADILSCKKYLQTTAPSVKMMAEHLMLTIPTLKK